MPSLCEAHTLLQRASTSGRKPKCNYAFIASDAKGGKNNISNITETLLTSSQPHRRTMSLRNTLIKRFVLWQAAGW
jgi:hypothetical protein